MCSRKGCPEFNIVPISEGRKKEKGWQVEPQSGEKIGDLFSQEGTEINLYLCACAGEKWRKRERNALRGGEAWTRRKKKNRKVQILT